MKCFILLLLLVVTGMPHLQAQAPIVRQPPAPLPAAPLPIGQWPSQNTVPRGTTLLVDSSDSVFPHICKVEQIYEFHLVCEGDRNPGDVAYERPFIEAIQIAPRGYVALSGTKRFALLLGGLGVGFAVLCGSGDSHICTTPAYAGLSLLATGVALHFVQLHLKHKSPKMLYEASGPVERPFPRIFGVRFPQPQP